MERLAMQLARDTVEHGDRVVIASGPGAWVERVAATGAEYLALPTTSRGTAAGTPAAVAKLQHDIRRLHPQVVHSHNVRATALARLSLLAAHQQAALVPTLHGVEPGDYRAASRVLRLTAHRVIACSPSVARSLRAAGFPGSKIDVIANGAALLPAGQDRRDLLRQSLGLAPGPLVIGIGRLVEQKDWPVFIQAANRVTEVAGFVVAGDGPLRQQLVDLAARCDSPVRFIGIVDDIPALLALASCVVFTSRWEGLPLALLESLSLGVPVVATAVDGVTDLAPGAALLVPPGDPAAVGTAISRVLADEELATSLRAAALNAAGAWRLDRMLSQYRIAYGRAAAGRSTWV
jgi:glycosyltransferase involved in cell wall biosynthesis